MAFQVSTTRESRSPSLRVSFPCLSRHLGESESCPRLQRPPNSGLKSCPALPLREMVSIFFLIIWLRRTVRGISVAPPGIKPLHPALAARSLNPLNHQESPRLCLYGRSR